MNLILAKSHYLPKDGVKKRKLNTILFIISKLQWFYVLIYVIMETQNY